jgi:polyferredoxin
VVTGDAVPVALAVVVVAAIVVDDGWWPERWCRYWSM